MVSIRNEREIELIRESSQIVYEVLNHLGNEVRPGVSERELDEFAEDFIRSRGALSAFKGYMGYPSTLCISVNDEVVHGIPDNQVLKDGDIVSIDCGVLKDGYYGDSARTYAVGTVNSDISDLMKVTEEALYLGIEQAKDDNHVSDIGYAIQTYVEKYRYSVVRELVGHGIGTKLHEEPQIPNYGEPGQGLSLQSGMCLAIEPMVNFGKKEVYTKQDGWTICTKDGEPSAHFEHTIVVTDKGGKILSNGVLDG